MAELNSPQMNGVGPGGDRRAYFTGADVYGNPMYEWYSAQEDGTADDWEAAEMANIYDWNKSQFNNWYNSPEQQIKRLEAAGMNPLFFLANNAGNQPAQGPAGASAPNVKHANNKMSNILSASKNAADSLLSTQQQALDYDIKRRQQEIDLRRVKVEEGRLGNETRGTNQNIAESQSRMRFNDAQIERLGKENQWTDQQIANAQTENAKMTREIDLIGAEIGELASRVTLNEANAKKAFAEIPVLREQVKLISAQTGLTTQQTEESLAKCWNFLADTQLKDVEIEVQEGQKVVLEKTAEGIEIKNEYDRTYGGWERVQGIIGGYIHSLAEGANAIINVRTGGAAAALSESKKNVLDKGLEEETKANDANRKFKDLYDEMTDKQAKADWYGADDDSYEAKRARAEANEAARKFQDYNARHYKETQTNMNPTFTLDY